MPSKSKAQAHLMAAAAHNPDIAKDAGIPQGVAHDFNQADKEEGTLKKGSDVPEHVNEEVINEANGVGIINVPPTLLKQVQKYVGSVLLTMGLMKQHSLEEKGYDQQAIALNNYLKRFQRKYNASVLSITDMKKYINSVSTIKLDPDAIFNELPENIKKRPGTKDIIQNLTMRLRLSNQLVGRGGSSHTHPSAHLNVQEIGIPTYEYIKNGSIESLAHRFNYSMGAVEHELQHAIQNVVLGQLNQNDKQTEMKPGYQEMDDAYHASGIEYGPQVKDLINAAKNWLEENPDDITGNKNTDISNAIKHSMSSLKQGVIIKALRNYKHDDRANKAMKLIYRDLNKFYQTDFADMNDSGDLDTTEKDVFGDTKDYFRSLEMPEAGETIIGDLWLSFAKYFGEPPTGYGSYDNLTEIRVERPYGEIIIEPNSSGGVHLYVRITGDREKSWNIELDEKNAKQLIQNVGYFSTVDSTQKLKVKLEDDTAPKADLKNADYDVYDVEGTESIFNDDPNKSVISEHDEDEGTVYISFKGARKNMYVQENGQKYYIGYGEEQGGLCKTKDFKKVMEILISFYYESETTDRMISRVLRGITKTGEDITPSSVRNEVDYTKQLASEREEEVVESSMRGLADIVQNAELEHDIDDANDQELINKGVLEEMPLKYDSFMGMDPQIYVDNSAQKRPYKNMTPVKNHGEWTTYKGPDGYMAYDNDTNEALAAIEGHEHHGWFNVDVTASSRHVKGVVYQMFMDIVKVEGTPILSGRLQSDDAIKFWKRLIQSHKVFVVANGEVLQQATPEKFHKYWSDEEGSPQSQFQFLLVK